MFDLLSECQLFFSTRHRLKNEGSCSRRNDGKTVKRAFCKTMPNGFWKLIYVELKEVEERWQMLSYYSHIY